MPRGHRTAELRSIALHGRVAELLDEELLELARSRVESWLTEGGPVPPGCAQRWHELLAQPLPAIVRALTEDSEEMQALRQNTPFAGVVPARERWRILREVQ